MGIQDISFLLNSDRVVDNFSSFLAAKIYRFHAVYCVYIFVVSHVLFCLRSYVELCFVNRSDTIDGDKLFSIFNC